jgi:hypothetical protein
LKSFTVFDYRFWAVLFCWAAPSEPQVVGIIVNQRAPRKKGWIKSGQIADCPPEANVQDVDEALLLPDIALQKLPGGSERLNTPVKLGGLLPPLGNAKGTPAKGPSRPLQMFPVPSPECRTASVRLTRKVQRSST